MKSKDKILPLHGKNTSSVTRIKPSQGAPPPQRSIKKPGGTPEVHLKMLTEQMPAILWSTDRKLRFTHSTGSGLEGLDLKPNQVIGLSLFDFFETQDRTYLPIASHLLALEGASSTYEFKWNERTFHCHVEPMRNADGTITGAIGVALDITDRKEAEESLKRQSNKAIEYQKALLNLAKLGNRDLDMDLEQITRTDSITMGVERVSIWFFNKARDSIRCAILYKKTEDTFERGSQLNSKDYPRYFNSLEQSRIIPAHHAHSDPRTREFSKTYLKPFGITSMMDVPIRVGGKVIGIVCHEHVGTPRVWSEIEQDFVGSIADLVSLAVEASEKKKAQEALKRTTEELIRSNQELEQFAYVASHDLQEPLHKIIAFGDRLQELLNDAISEKGKDYLQRMERAAERMRTLIEDLLQIARVTTRSQPFQKIDLNKVLEEVLSDVEILLKKTKGEIKINKLPMVRGDSLQLHQVFQNLICNALKFSRLEKPPKIQITSKTIKKGWVEIILTDNGIGIEEEYYERIFLPFQRLHGQEKFEGSGMGLTLCKKIIERHGGKITVESQLGKGSKFILKFPLANKGGESAYDRTPATL